MQTTSVSLKDISLSIPIFAPNQRRLLGKSTLMSAVGGSLSNQNGRVYVDALKRITIEASHGEHLALIGHNGAGKSTLLRVIAGIYPPSSGSMTINGTVGCLLETGAGVMPEMTGYECIRLQNLMHNDFGNDWRETAEDIAEFTELGEYLSLPLRTYSAGMRARLIAALATAWPRDILLIDEGIGTGDAAFQNKFAQRIEKYLSHAGLLAIASHNQSLLEKYCAKGVVLEQGKVLMIGTLSEALTFYAKHRAH